MRRLIVTILTVVVLALVADQVGRVVLEHRVADHLGRSELTAQRVQITGWPVLLRLATGGLDVAVTAVEPFDALPVPGRGSAEGPGTVTWSGENGLLIAQLGTDGPRLASQVTADGGDVVVTPVSVQIRGLQVPIEMLGARAERLLGSAAQPHRIDAAALGLPDRAAFTAASVTADGVRITVTTPLDRLDRLG